MGLFDMAKKLIGTIPVIGPIIEKGSSFIDMLPRMTIKKQGRLVDCILKVTKHLNRLKEGTLLKAEAIQ